jgi:hypothetical protein
MYRTAWRCESRNGNIVLIFYYHFGKDACFPHEEIATENYDTITLLWNNKLINTFEMFKKCLRKKVEIKA